MQALDIPSRKIVKLSKSTRELPRFELMNKSSERIMSNVNFNVWFVEEYGGGVLWSLPDGELFYYCNIHMDELIPKTAYEHYICNMLNCVVGRRLAFKSALNDPYIHTNRPDLPDISDIALSSGLSTSIEWKQSLNARSLEQFTRKDRVADGGVADRVADRVAKERKINSSKLNSRYFYLDIIQRFIASGNVPLEILKYTDAPETWVDQSQPQSVVPSIELSQLAQQFSNVKYVPDGKCKTELYIKPLAAWQWFRKASCRGYTHARIVMYDGDEEYDAIRDNEFGFSTTVGNFCLLGNRRVCQDETRCILAIVLVHEDCCAYAQETSLVLVLGKWDHCT